MTFYTRDIRGIPLWLLREYLIELGGEALDEHQVQGNGWQVTLTQLPDYQIGSLVVGEVRLEMRAVEADFPQIKAMLEKKLIRAGG